MSTKRPTIAERTLREQVDRIQRDIDHMDADIKLRFRVMDELLNQRSALEAAITNLRARNAKP